MAGFSNLDLAGGALHRFGDSKAFRTKLFGAERHAETVRLLRLLPSNYVSDIPHGPNYSMHMTHVAEERVRLDEAIRLVQADEFYETTRSGFLYQVIGHRLHDVFPSFFPPVQDDVEYREFCLALLRIVFQGAKAKSLEEGGRLLLDLISREVEIPLKVVQLFRHSLPHDIDGPYDIGNQFMFYYDVLLPPAQDLAGVNLDLGYRGLQFAGRLLKAAHELYDIRLIIQDGRPDIPSVNRHCRTVMEEGGVLKAWYVIKDVTPADEADDVAAGVESRPAIFDGVIDNVVRFYVDSVDVGSGTIQIGSTLVELVNGFDDKGILVLEDDVGRPITIEDIQPGDLVTAFGVLEGNPMEEDLDKAKPPGYFPIQEKIKERESICVRSRWVYEDNRQENVQRCWEDPANKTVRCVDEVHTTLISKQRFVVNNLPIVSDPMYGDPPGQAEWNPNNITVTVDGIGVDVGAVNPLTGEVFLVISAPQGSEVIISYCTMIKPTYGMLKDTIGMNKDSGPGSAFQVVKDIGFDPADVIQVSLPTGELVADPESWTILNHAGDLPDVRGLNDDGNVLNTLFEDDGAVVTVTVPRPEHVQLCAPTQITYNYIGYEKGNSSIKDDLFGLFKDTRSPVRNEKDDANVVDSLGKQRGAVTFGEVSEHFMRLATTAVLSENQVLVEWTQDVQKAINKVFTSKHRPYIASLSSQLNELSLLVNSVEESGGRLNRGDVENVRIYLQDLYSALIAYTDMQILEGCCRQSSVEDVGLTVRLDIPETVPEAKIVFPLVKDTDGEIVADLGMQKDNPCILKDWGDDGALWALSETFEEAPAAPVDVLVLAQLGELVIIDKVDEV